MAQPRNRMHVDDGNSQRVRYPRRMRVATLALALAICALLIRGGARVGAGDSINDSTRNAISNIVESRNAPIDFAREVLPVLASRCFRCHGGVREMAGLNLSSEASIQGVLKSGHTAVMPHDAQRSALHARVTSTDANERMPPDGERLTAAQVDAITRWIEQGAPWGTHWAFTPRVDPPIVARADDAWSRVDLDRIVLARLRDARVQPAPEAPTEMLLRRVCLDITGIPPTPQQRAEFLSDTRIDAYEHLVDALLNDNAYGERFARVWLDLARYADSQGYEKDSTREIWAWRDWVIDALNRDMPYDQFAVRLLAGDLLANASDDDRLATAFHRNTLTNSEGGTDDEEFRMAAVFDRVSTTWQSFLGVTFQCAQCHGHPYDPFTHREYYEFLACLNQTEDADRDDDAPRLALTRQGVNASVPVMRELALESRRTTHVLARGALTSPTDVVAAGVPMMLKSPTARASESSAQDAPMDRLSMAQWLASKENPLFARVAANRVWELFFGRGVVHTSEDFGVMGSGASDQMLLDHLAGVLIAHDFSMKALIKEIVCSAVYRQSSVASAHTRAHDSENLLWSRAGRVRLEAEQIRDSALAVSGLLSRKQGGAPVMPPQPDGVWQVVYSGDAWKVSTGEDRYRRAIYTFLRRSSPYPSFIAFDSTSRESCTVRRIRTNTPLAALVLLNDPVYLECAQALARTVRDEHSDVAAVRVMLQRALGRDGYDDEVTTLTQLVTRERERYATHEPEARILSGDAASAVEPSATQDSVDFARNAALVAAANAILNLDDFLTRS